MSENSNKIRLILGDSLEVLKRATPNSIDSIVCDPPYGISFMSSKWDYDVPSVDIWKECYRVLKPGGYLLSFAGTRTQHRMAVNIEDAGFEIRDMIAWVYGSGFPKSLNIGKAIDKINGESGRLLKFVEWMRTTGLKPKQVDDLLKEKGMISPTSNFAIHYFNDGQPAIPTAKMWEVVRPICGVIPKWVDELVERIEAEREVVGTQTTNLTVMQNIGGQNISGEIDITKGNSEWEGWGTALKPALEPITVARKPLSEKTVAENVLKWGTGGINIDGSRVEIPENDKANYEFNNNGLSRMSRPEGDKLGQFDGGWKIDKTIRETPQGRFPANLIHDGSDEVVSLFPDTKHGGSNYAKGTRNNWLGENKIDYVSKVKDSGSAARFFYCAKASKADRDEGLEGLSEPEEQLAGLDTRGRTLEREDGTKTLVERWKPNPRKNNHPTVKPTKLMQYLVKLVTPKGGTVLDPFMGSGSTGKACKLEGFDFIGIEREPEYVEIAKARIGL